MDADCSEFYYDCSEVFECLQKEELRAKLEQQLAMKCEECEALMMDMERANDRLSEIDGQTASVTEKVCDPCFNLRICMTAVL